MTPEQLKVSIFQSAFQGKLVPVSDYKNNDVDGLIKSIHDEKIALEKNGKIKKTKKLPEITESECLYDIPSSWRWVRLNDIVFNHGQKTPDKTFSYIDIGSIDNIHQKLNDEENLIEADNAPSRARKIVEYGDIIYATVRPYLHNTCIIDKQFKAEPIASTGFAVLACHKGVLNNYLFYYLLSPAFDSYANATDNAKGVAYPAINDDKLYRAVVPLPPLEEQHRIVAKIEELLPYVDRYAEAYEKLEQFNAKFPEDMKKSILQYAIQGKLVEQRPEEGTAGELYQQIQDEKQKLIKAGKIKKEKPLAEISEDDIPFEIPESWKWVRLGQCGCFERGSGIKKDETSSDGFPCVRYGQLYTTYKTRFSEAVSHVPQEVFDKCKKAYKNDLLMALTGENEYDIALAVTYEGDEELAIGGDMTRFFNHCMNPLYLTYVLNSRYGILCKSKMATGNIIVHISNDKLATIPIPLPPLEEQSRIVEKIEELLPYCDRLVK